MCIWKQEGEKKTNQRRMASRHNQARHETVSLTGSVVMIMEAPILPQISTLKFRVRRKMPNHGTVFTLSQMKRIIDASQHRSIPLELHRKILHQLLQLIFHHIFVTKEGILIEGKIYRKVNRFERIARRGNAM